MATCEISPDHKCTLGSKLDDIALILKDLKTEIKTLNEAHTNIRVWKAEIEERLKNGNKRFEQIEKTLNNKLDKTLILAYILGAVGGAAGLIKLLG